MHLAREYLLALDEIWTTTLKHFLQTAFSYRYNLRVSRGFMRSINLTVLNNVLVYK